MRQQPELGVWQQQGIAVVDASSTSSSRDQRQQQQQQVIAATGGIASAAVTINSSSSNRSQQSMDRYRRSRQEGDTGRVVRTPLVEQTEAFRRSQQHCVQQPGQCRIEVALALTGVSSRGMSQNVVEKIKKQVGVDVRIVEQREGRNLLKILLNSHEDGVRIITNSWRWIDDGWMVGWWRVGGKRRLGNGALLM